MTHLGSNKLRKVTVYYLNKGKKKHNTKSHSSNIYIKCLKQKSFLFTSGIEMSHLRCLPRERGRGGDHLKQGTLKGQRTVHKLHIGIFLSFYLNY